MSKIFISHSSKDNFEALALAQWLSESGWREVFLDLDPDRGIAAGERWERRLHEASQRCEAIIFLVSKQWLASGWCAKEYALARALNKKLFAVIIEPGLGIAALPPEYAGTWQATDLCAGQDARLFRIALPGSQEERHIAFSQAGLRRLKNGLDKAGLDPKFFAWPPEDEPRRAPYRGLRAMEEADAGVFFGREAPIVVAADRLRGLREAAAPRLLVLLGASGAGKSSFLRAGLLPRLKRDDAHFFCLAPIRPERAALTGENGLIGALQKAFPDRARALLREAIEAGAAGLRPLLAELAQAALARTLAGEDAGKAPTIVLAIDQAEELFRVDGAAESATLLELVRDLTQADDPALIVVFVIRSDSYDRLEHAPALEGLAQATLPLLPLPRGNYRHVIEGPAARAEQAGQKLAVEPALTQRLLEDIEKGGGGDALPLLAFALEQLIVEYGAAGALRLADFEKFGGLEGAIAKAVERAFAAADSDRRIPQDRTAREALLRRGLVPWLAGIDPDTRSPRRNIALKSDIPEEARPLIDLLVEERLLVSDISSRDGQQVETLEPAHEALLRQWGLLRGWLEDDLGRLATLEGARRAARDWDANARAEGWLAHQGGRLAEARALDARPDLAAQLEPRDRAYLQACSAREAAAAAEREKARADELGRAKAEAERARAGARFARNLTLVACVAALALAAVGAWAWAQRGEAVQQKQNAEAATAEAVKQKANAEAETQEAQQQGRLADAARVQAEQRRLEADAARAQADAQRQEAESARNQAEARRKEAEDAKKQAEAERMKADAARKRAESLVATQATADELLEGDGKVEQMRQCMASTARVDKHPPPPPSLALFIGRWHVDQELGSTDVDWKADGTCESKSVFNGIHAVDTTKDVCTWQFKPLSDKQFEVDYQSKKLGADFPKQLRFTIISPTHIHNSDYQYDAFRIFCPAQELALYRSDLADLQQRADSDPNDLERQRALADGIQKIGEVLTAQGDNAGALNEFVKEYEIRRNLALSDETNRSWQRDLSFSDERVGLASQANGQGADAARAFRASLEIRKKLFLADANYDSEHDLADAYERVGGILNVQEKDRKGAHELFKRAVQLRQALSDANPTNVASSIELVVSLYFLSTASDSAEAKDLLNKALALTESLDRDAKLPPAQAGWPASLRAEIAKLP